MGGGNYPAFRMQVPESQQMDSRTACAQKYLDKVRAVVQIWVDTSGSWSGGGAVVLTNLGLAAKQRPDLLSLSWSRHRLRLVPRNFPVSKEKLAYPFLLMPQNAWAWQGSELVFDELPRRTVLAIGSRFAMRRSSGVLRIASTIPAKANGSTKGAEILPNVLDEGFEEALERQPDLQTDLSENGYFFSMGASHSYRNLLRLVKGYDRYWAAGGRIPLVLATGPGSRQCYNVLRDHAQSTAGVRIIPGLDRPAALTAMRGARGVIAPALVEASPVSVLEALAMTPRVALSDIPGHREIVSENLTEGPMFAATDIPAIAGAFQRLEEGEGFDGHHQQMRLRRYRSEARELWVQGLCRRLEALV